jgi:DNA polymerase III alpha subunit
MKKFFGYLVKFFKYLPQILTLFKELNSLLSMLKAEEKQDNKEQKPANSEHKTEDKQEKPNTEVASAKPMFDEKKLNYLENKSYFLANVGTLKKFESLSEETKTLAPDLFKKQFPKVVKEKSEKPGSDTYEEKTTRVVDEGHRQRKNELINKVTFIVNKCGTSSDFEKLPDEVRTMDPVLFKEKSKDCKF